MKRQAPKNNLKIGFASLLRDLRVKAGLSQGDVRKVLGYTSPQFISNWERGLSDPPVETVVKLANLYRVPMDALLENYIQIQVQSFEQEIRSKISKTALKKAA